MYTVPYEYNCGIIIYILRNYTGNNNGNEQDFCHLVRRTRSESSCLDDMPVNPMSPFQPPPPPPPPPKVEPLPEQEWVKQLDPATVCKDGRTVADRVDLLKEAAGEQFRDGNHRMAIQMYSEALKLAPSHTLFSNRSACYCASRKYKEAFEDACKCIDMMPTFGKVGTNSCAPHCEIGRAHV